MSKKLKMTTDEFNAKYYVSENIQFVSQKFAITITNDMLKTDIPPEGVLENTVYDNSESTYYLEEKETEEILCESNNFTDIQEYITTKLNIEII